MHNEDLEKKGRVRGFSNLQSEKKRTEWRGCVWATLKKKKRGGGNVWRVLGGGRGGGGCAGGAAGPVGRRARREGREGEWRWLVRRAGERDLGEVVGGLDGARLTVFVYEKHEGVGSESGGGVGGWCATPCR